MIDYTDGRERESERLAAESRQLVPVFDFLLLDSPANEMVHHRFFDEGFHVERIESPIDRVPLGERVVHRDKRRVLFICITTVE